MGQSIGGPRIRVNAKGIEQKGTTYHWNYQYSGTQPHAPTRIGGRTVDYEASGNQLGWETDQNGTCRTIDGDGANRIQSVADQGRTSTYAYDELGQRVLKAGSGGRTVYINRYYSVRNGAIATKPVFAGDLQIVYLSPIP